MVPQGMRCYHFLVAIGAFKMFCFLVLNQNLFPFKTAITVVAKDASTLFSLLATVTSSHFCTDLWI
jgi:hypothetical protein